jgi:thiaminase/transcriptional activator TenA
VSVSAAELWQRNRDLADACLAHPFVRGIASGELEHRRFQLYVAQDACFLEAFARAYALALARCPDREGLAVFKDLLVGVFDELRLRTATSSCAPPRSSPSATRLRP